MKALLRRTILTGEGIASESRSGTAIDGIPKGHPAKGSLLRTDAPGSKQWLCCCVNATCKGEGPWFTDTGDREFFVTAEQEPRCPECGEEGWVYPY